MEEKWSLAQSNEGKLFNFRLVLFAAIYLAIGVVYCYYHHFKSVSLGWLFAILPVLALPILLAYPLAKWRRMLVVFALLCTCLFTGFLGLNTAVRRYERMPDFGECNFSGRVVEIREKSSRVEVVLDNLKVDGEKQNCKLIAYLPASFKGELTLSDVLFLGGEVGKVELNAENFSSTAKDFGEKIYLIAKDADGAKTGHEFDLFLFLNTRAKKVIDRGMDETPAAVTKAVLLGDATGIEYNLYNNIRRGGIAHIFAVSGLHVGSLFAFCLLLLKKTRMKELHSALQFAFVAVVLYTYAGVCAFSASVVRAMVICLVGYFAKLLQVKVDFLQALGAAAICILLFNPSALFTVGFQLSFTACFGIAFLSKPIGQVVDECAKLY